MQTFLPYPDFTDSARALDLKRLGKQRVETIQVLRALTVPGYGWRRHPAAAMWAGYEEALVRYGLDICGVWTADGRADTCATTLLTDLRTGIGTAWCAPRTNWRPPANYRPGWGIWPYTTATGRRWSGRTPDTTARCFPTCPMTCPMSGRHPTGHGGYR